VSDYFTKPLQGALFRKMRNLIMNIDPDATSRWDHRSVMDGVEIDPLDRWIPVTSKARKPK
jgi:hypothetical protein